MAKKYQGKSMAKSSRFVAYLKKMDPSELSRVEERIEFYVEDNKEYCDKGNYRHLCNIFTSMALYDVLTGSGLSMEKAEGVVFETMYAYMQRQKRKFQRLAAYGWFWPLIKKIVPVGFKKGSGVGWKYTWHKETPKNEFRFECNQCIYRPIFQKYGLERFGPKFCYNDIIVYGELPRTDFIRTKTLSRGDDVCDFRFIRHRKKETFKRSESI